MYVSCTSFIWSLFLLNSDNFIVLSVFWLVRFVLLKVWCHLMSVDCLMIGSCVSVFGDIPCKKLLEVCITWSSWRATPGSCRGSNVQFKLIKINTWIRLRNQSNPHNAWGRFFFNIKQNSSNGYHWAMMIGVYQMKDYMFLINVRFLEFFLEYRVRINIDIMLELLTSNSNISFFNSN